MARGAMHYRGTFDVSDDHEAAARAARYAARDAAYRAALGISPGEPLPGRLGESAGHGRSITRAGRMF